MDNQQGDVNLFQTDDDGDITVVGGIVTMVGGLETSAYLSLFGGNEDLSNWWGNIDADDKSKEYRSETQNLLQSIPATTGNLRRIEDAANRDLAWFITDKVASSVAVVVTMPALNKIKITVNIDGGSLEFVENWKASK